MKRFKVYCFCTLIILLLVACNNNNMNLSFEERAVVATYQKLVEAVNDNEYVKNDTQIILECYTLEGNKNKIRKTWEDESATEEYDCVFVYYEMKAEVINGGIVSGKFEYCYDKNGKVIAGAELSEINEKYEDDSCSDEEINMMSNVGIGVAFNFEGWREFKWEDIEEIINTQKK